MKKFKQTTIRRKRAIIMSDIHIIEVEAAARVKDLRYDLVKLQERCPHEDMRSDATPYDCVKWCNDCQRDM